MRALFMTGIEEPLEIRHVPLPEMGPDDAIVKITASGICRSDWHFWCGHMHLPLPTVLGHEIGGVVAAVGSSVRHLKVGQAVTVPFNLACGQCGYCRHGSQHMCDNGSTPLTSPGSGGWAEYCRIPNAELNCVRLPENVDELSAAALGCRYMTSWHALRDRAELKSGEFVLVMGCGGVGLAAIEIGTALGGLMIAVDVDDAKLAYAKTLGAVATINVRGMARETLNAEVRAMTGGLGAHIAVDALGGSKTSIPGLTSMRKGGRLIQIGVTSGDEDGHVSMPVDEMVHKEWSIVGSLGSPHGSFPELLNLVAAGRLKPGALVSRKVGLEGVNDVLASMGSFGTTGYVVITF
jgi:propanol-preferring alcohol dehydrogenase